MSQKRIMIVDDQPHIIRVIKLALKSKSYRVDTALNGAEALEKLRRERYDVLITDLEMPKMNGKELCETLHAELPDPKPFTLIITAKTNPELRSWAAVLPHTEFLEKPLSLRWLERRLNDYFVAGPNQESLAP